MTFSLVFFIVRFEYLINYDYSLIKKIFLLLRYLFLIKRKYVLAVDALVLVSVKIAQSAQLVAIIKIYKSIKKLSYINVFYRINRSSIRTFLNLI